MGCLFSICSNDKEPELENETPAQFSWEKKDRPDPKDFTIAEVKGETVGRMPGTVNGQQFIIDKCEDCDIYIFDHSATITIDSCTNCRIFIGPSKGSVFFRECRSCKCVVSCQQFRSRDCRSMDIRLHCETQPIIEASTKMRFGCFQFYYPELIDQFKSSGLCMYNNNWSNIHDFSPVPGEENWTLIDENSKDEDILPLPTAEPFSNIQISLDVNRSVIPVTRGKRRKISDEVYFVLFFYDETADENMRKVIQSLRNEGCALLDTKQVNLCYDDILRLFGALPNYKEVTKKGPATALHFNGPDVMQKCQAFVKDLANSSVTYLPPDQEKAAKDMENWNNFVDMQLTM